nr:MAG TPA: replication protein O [Caudoviricetes sp.]
MKDRNESFIFYASFHEALSSLDDAQYGKIMRIINDYAIFGIVPELHGIEKMAFTLIKPQLDANNTKRNNYLQSTENGKKGGRPERFSQEEKTQIVQESQAGLSIEEIAKDHKCSARLIYKVLSEEPENSEAEEPGNEQSDCASPEQVFAQTAQTPFMQNCTNCTNCINPVYAKLHKLNKLHKPPIDFAQTINDNVNVNANVNVNDNANSLSSDLKNRTEQQDTNSKNNLAEKRTDITPTPLPQKSTSAKTLDYQQDLQSEKTPKSSAADFTDDANTGGKIKKPPDRDAILLAEKLYKLHQQNCDNGFKTTASQLERWADDIEKLHRIDNRRYSEIGEVIEWAKSDSFWQSNIISGRKLREKYSQLFSKMRGGQSARASPPDTRHRPEFDFNKAGNVGDKLF